MIQKTLLLSVLLFANTNAWSICLPDGTISGSNGQITLGSAGCATASNDTATLISGASITNLAGDGLIAPVVPWAITSSGSITTSGVGISLLASGSINLLAGATINSNSTGIVATGNNTPPITLINAGVISSTNSSGAQLLGGATVTNLAGGIIEGSFVGIDLSSANGPNPSGGPSTVMNAGIIRSTSGFNDGILFGMGGSLVNQSSGLVDGFLAAAFSAAGSVDNYGQIGTLTNSSTAIGLTQGGTVNNYQGGQILAQSRGISIDGQPGTINNAGTITSSLARAINISAGGTINNTATGVINAYSRAIYSDVGGPVVINNAGIINGNMANLNYMTIEIHADNSAVVNTGTINGNTTFLGSNSTFTLKGGTVNGNIAFSGSNDLFFVNAGTLNGTLTMGAGGNETLVLSYVNNSNLGNGSVLNGGGGGFNQLTFSHSQYIGGSKITNWETINLINQSTLTLTSNLILGGTSADQTATLNILNSTLNARNGLNTVIEATNSTPVLVNNAGIINISSPTANNSLSVLGDYVGQQGIIVLNAVLGGNNSPADKFIINGINGGSAISGLTYLQVNNLNGIGGLTTGNGILLVQAINGSTTTQNAFSLLTPIRLGIYDYRLLRGGLNPNDPATSQDWFLRSFNHGLPIIGPELSVYGSVMPTAMNIGRLTLGTFNEREGDEVNVLTDADLPSKNYFSAIWVRALGQNYQEQYSSIADPSANGNISGLQLGFNVYRGRSTHGDHNFAGFYLAYADANEDIHGNVSNALATAYVNQHTGSVTLKAGSGGLYWTHFWKAGAYFNLVAEASTLHGIANSTRTGISVHGEGANASAEFGYPMHLPVAQWLIEPEVQLLYQYIKMDNSADMYSTIDLGASNAVIGRLGARLKYSKDTGKYALLPFLHANLWSVISGNTNSVNFADTGTLTTSAKNCWLQLGGGINITTAKFWSTYVYLDELVGMSASNHGLHGIDGGLGLRMNF